MDDEIVIIGGVKIKDTGYTKLCPQCSRRYGDMLELIGKTRNLHIVKCWKCRSAERDKRRETFH